MSLRRIAVSGTARAVRPQMAAAPGLAYPPLIACAGTASAERPVHVMDPGTEGDVTTSAEFPTAPTDPESGSAAREVVPPGLALSRPAK
ncbi:hypothetical protein [Saccharopolyspora sp. NPDC050642]|uniref:hypothetical protein n=1 Tax=Saccharopolyspora sp. NPDC050642 TaxID=3157099 RepID=UPI0033CF2F87